MFWDDLKHIMKEIAALKQSLLRIEHAVFEIKTKQKNDDDINKAMSEKISDFQASFEDTFCSTEEDSSINRLHDKLNLLVSDERRKESVHKLNEMINEFKGCVSMARAAIGEGKALTTSIQQVENIASISQNIYKAMTSFVEAGEKIKHEAHFKIDVIYRALCEKKEKESF